ncbi:uncharacterized protein PAC_20172 [Phialocephala subalpina]|uniref:Rhodopsin domain-containing protein n=1 Tax=Phialocephala subalpina TaxID=576137 RepID=A0A1L7XYY6_9HELO|nr:uncharacterized protein PAC_20172 [Phialocephala subalpina]
MMERKSVFRCKEIDLNVSHERMSNSTSYVVIIVLTIVVSYLITSIRFYSRSRSDNGFSWSLSDTIIVTSLVLQTLLAGIGIKIVCLPDVEDPQTIIKLFEAGALLYYSTLWSIKISISISLVRLTEQLDQAARFAKCCFYLVCITFLAAISTQLLQCIPLSTLWEGTCGTKRKIAAFWTAIGLNIGTDIMLVIVPFPALSLITMRRVRIAISIVFGLAGIVVIVSIVRAILVAKHPAETTNLIVVLSHFEIAAGTIISALPEVSRTFTRLYLQRSNTTSYGFGTSDNQQRSQGTTNGVILSTSEGRERFANLKMKRSHDRINDIEGGSANGRPDSSSEQSVWGFHDAASADQISPYPIERSSLTDEMQGKEGIVRTTVFEMRDL